jgi:membrane associated rhomboid family serine protease
MNSTDTLHQIWDTLQSGKVPPILQLQARILLGCVAVLWVLEIIDELLLRGGLNYFGIRPRQWVGLRGILIAPLLHGNLQHLATNTMPFIILGWLVMIRGLYDFLIVTAIAWITSGLGVWFLASSRSNHIGASGLIFGYLGFLLTRGYVERSILAIAIAILASVLYGGLIWGILPLRRGVSWQGHLFGLVGGILTAWYLTDLKNWVTEITR